MAYEGAFKVAFKVVIPARYASTRLPGKRRPACQASHCSTLPAGRWSCA
ncbi:MAG: hypothetical protein AW10_01646 [Candidatus Accumulibacter appositus]|uniref:Uncharacterized protein n=1 Tax=Candidatus Accumulibacter appositus TaxID=1454003 RepID=A0A011QPD2_9PROT|nr:MAG: hypothetical protein AW10_01646 [Candidatus Accumulibacter appositus]